MSGFSWNPIIERWHVEPEVRQHLIEVSFPLIALQWNIHISGCHVINIVSCIGQTGIAAWMNKSVRNYEKMVQLYR